MMLSSPVWFYLLEATAKSFSDKEVVEEHELGKRGYEPSSLEEGHKAKLDICKGSEHIHGFGS
jgi:hypothetical protein